MGMAWDEGLTRYLEDLDEAYGLTDEAWSLIQNTVGQFVESVVSSLPASAETKP